jgi:hypothetical protein
MTEAILLVACALLAGAVVALAVAHRRLDARTARELDALRAELRRDERADLSPGLVTGVGAPSSTGETASAPSSTGDTTPVVTETEYVITRLGEPTEVAPVDQVERPDARLFADLVLRESVVKAASFAHGVRRGLSAENRNRIRFEMRRELKRARKQRKAEEREAVREWRARQRAAMAEDDAA